MKSVHCRTSGILLMSAVFAVTNGPDNLEARAVQTKLSAVNVAVPAARPKPVVRKTFSSHEVLSKNSSRNAISASTAEALTAVVKKNCAGCHNDQRKGSYGNLSLQGFDLLTATGAPEVSEKMIGKLRAGMMPPPGKARPAGDTLQLLAESLEKLLDAKAITAPNPGGRVFQRLNRAEYESTIRHMLGLEVDAGSWLPLDTKSANFDNIADVQTPSATLLDAYMDAASEISRLAVGDPAAKVATSTYKLPRLASQVDQVEGRSSGNTRWYFGGAQFSCRWRIRFCGDVASRADWSVVRIRRAV